MYEKEFIARLTKLRIEKGVSARDMSLSLGQTESYINRIENGKMLPSLTAFFYICEYFKLTPGDFFYCDSEQNQDVKDAYLKLLSLDDSKREHIIALIKDL